MLLPLSIIASVLVVFFSTGRTGPWCHSWLCFISLPSKLPGGVFDPGLCSWWVPGLKISGWQWSERWVVVCGDTMKTTLITYHLHWYIDKMTLSCVTKASEEFLPCGLHPVTGQQAGEFVRISHSLNVCSGEATVCFFRGKSRTWQTWIPTSLCRRNNPSDFWPLAMCEAHLSWMFASQRSMVFSDSQFWTFENQNWGIIRSKCLDRNSTCNDIDVHPMGWMRSCSVPSRLWCFWVLVDLASPYCC